MERVHHLKILSGFLDAVLEGVKRFEIRTFDRDYRIGDILDLREVGGGKRSAQLRVVYMSVHLQQAGVVVLGLQDLPDEVRARWREWVVVKPGRA